MVLTAKNPVSGITLAEYLSDEMGKIVALVADASAQLNFPVYLVGGLVRDWLLNRPSSDLDFAFEGNALAVGELLLKKHGGKLVKHLRFGTAKWYLPADLAFNGQDYVDLITTREEEYKQSAALPTVTFASIHEDLTRRDFTINAFALRLSDSAMIDPYNGLDDLKTGTIRTLHPLSFVDDPTRIFRALRYSHRLNYSLNQQTSKELSKHLEGIKLLSGERIQHELNLALTEAEPAILLKRLESRGVLEAIHPDLQTSRYLSADLKRIAEANAAGWKLPSAISTIPLKTVLFYLAWIHRHPIEPLQSILERIKLPQKIGEIILDAYKLNDSMSSFYGMWPSLQTKALEDINIVTIFARYSLSRSKEEKKLLELFALTNRHIKPATTGDDLISLGLEPGPKFESILWQLRAARIDGLIHTDDEEERYLEQLLH